LAPPRSLACLIGQPERSSRTLLLLMNAGGAAEDFVLPRGDCEPTEPSVDLMPLAGHSLMLLQQSSPRSALLLK